MCGAVRSEAMRCCKRSERDGVKRRDVDKVTGSLSGVLLEMVVSCRGINAQVGREEAESTQLDSRQGNNIQ